MVVLGIDYGTKRVGIARANTEAKLASPLLTLKNDTHLIKGLSEVIAQEAAEALIIGLPRGLDGQETPQTASVREFGDFLAQNTSCPIHWQDEAGTSLEAQKQLKKDKKHSLDSVAASIILQDYLDNL